MNRNLINKSIHEYSSSEEFLSFVKSLAIRPENAKNSKVIPEFTLIRGKKTIVRLKRDPKVLTIEEVSTLAQEHDMQLEELRDLLHTRKIKVLLEDGEYYAPPRAARKARAKKDAPSSKRTRKDDSRDQLIVSGSNPDLFKKELLHASEGTKE